MDRTTDTWIGDGAYVFLGVIIRLGLQGHQENLQLDLK